MTSLRLKPLAQHYSRSDAVLTSLRDALLSGAYAPGEQLREGHIATQLGVSKTPVREALASLRTSGLVESSSPGRTVVSSINAQTVRNLYEARNLIEPVGVLKSVPHMDEELLSEARSLLALSQEKGNERDLASLSKTNREFHELMCRRCGNQYIRGILEDMRDLLQFVAAQGWLGTSSWDQEREEHEAILAAAAQGDAQRAADLTTSHIDNASKRLARVN